MFKTFEGTNPNAVTLAGNVPTVGWAVINDGGGVLTFVLSGYPNEEFFINPGEMMRIPVPIATATVTGTTSYRAISFGLASLFQEFTRELPGNLSVPNGSVTTSKLSSQAINSTKLADSQGGQALDTVVETNAPVVGVQFDMGAAETKNWQADRKYRLVQFFFTKTVANGGGGDTINVLHSSAAGGVYTSIIGGAASISSTVGTTASAQSMSVTTINAGACLRITTVGGTSNCNVHLLLIPIA